MDHRHIKYLVVTLFMISSVSVYAQTGESSYELKFSPDLWYNDVDGIQIGTRVEGSVPGTTEEGPHRLTLAVWIGTWWPDLPASYRATYTEPLGSNRIYGNELAVTLNSSIREGYHNHGIFLGKRWQDGDDYLSYWELGIGYSFEKRFDHEYTLFPALWSGDAKGLLKPKFEHRHLNRFGRFSLNVDSRINTIDTFFYTGALTAVQQFMIGGQWQILTRIYSEGVSRNAYPEYRLFLSRGPEISTLERRLTRSKGTVPVSWAESGSIHQAGGANLRGFTERDIESITDGEPVHFDFVSGLNLEFDLPNPLQSRINEEPYMSEFISFRTYLFADLATASGASEVQNDRFYANTGIGLALSVNFPDYLGKPRGFAVRYEAPLWISVTDGEPQWKWRHLLGFGAVIAF